MASEQTRGAVGSLSLRDEFLALAPRLAPHPLELGVRHLARRRELRELALERVVRLRAPPRKFAARRVARARSTAL